VHVGAEADLAGVASSEGEDAERLEKEGACHSHSGKFAPAAQTAPDGPSGFAKNRRAAKQRQTRAGQAI
jgi:hypothetical protein